MHSRSSSGIKRTRRRHVEDLIDQVAQWETSRKDHFNTGAETYVYQHGRLKTGDFGGRPRGFQVMEDENHKQWLANDMTVRKDLGDCGGEMTSTKQSIITSGGGGKHLYRLDTGPGGYTEIIGRVPLLAIAPTDPLADFPSHPSRDLGPIGTEAINRCKPTNRPVSLSTDLAEAKSEGLPSFYGVNLWKEKTNLARGAGAEYLNSEFGWVPLVSDIRGACYAAANAHKILSSYERNSGKVVRRAYEFPIEKSESWATIASGSKDAYAAVNGTSQLSLLQDSLPPRGTIIRCTRFYRRTWFKGAFTYHLPLGYSSRNRLISAAAQAGPLLGIELTPDTVWNATPWTWALNWVSDVGDVVSNFSDYLTDGLVIRYGYIMEHAVSSNTYYFAGPDGYLPIDSTGRPDSVTFYVETKKRKRATPFGFQVSWQGFTPRQLAITAALGLTRWA